MNIKIEIYLYCTRLETFLSFLSYASIYLWDKLFPFKDQMVLRPSRSANQIRSCSNNILDQLKRIKKGGLNYKQCTNTANYDLEQLHYYINEISIMESLKTDLINSIITWIMCDANDMVIRKNRLCYFASHLRLVIIESSNNLADICQVKTDHSIIQFLEDNSCDEAINMKFDEWYLQPIVPRFKNDDQEICN